MTTLTDISLLSQDKLLVMCIVSTVLMTLVLSDQKHQWHRNRLPFHIGGGVLVGVLTFFSLQRIFELDRIPLDVIGWTFLIVFTISILFTIQRTRKRLAMAIAGALCSLFFVVLLANQYYQYFPTVGSIFNLSAAPKQGQVVSRANQITAANIDETDYIPPVDQPRQGRLDALSIPGDISHFKPRQGYIYLPPAALIGDRSVKLPVIILLAGVPGSPDDWKVRINLEEILNSFATQHHGLTPIVVVADQAGGNGFENTGCVDSPHGNVETYLTRDVPRYIQSHYNTKSGSENWAIGGFSDGATCSIVLGARHPDIYQTLMSLSGEAAPTAGSQQKTIALFFHGSEADYRAHDARTILQSSEGKQKLAHSAAWLTAGKDEESALVQANRDVFDLAKKAGLDVTLELQEGHHSFGLWKNAFIDALPWLSYHVGLTDCERACR